MKWIASLIIALMLLIGVVGSGELAWSRGGTGDVDENGEMAGASDSSDDDVDDDADDYDDDEGGDPDE